MMKSRWFKGLQNAIDSGNVQLVILVMLGFMQGFFTVALLAWF